MPEFNVAQYQISQPVQSHFRDATCQEVECGAFLQGWVTTVDVGTQLGADQANYIRMKSGRHFRVSQLADSSLVSFTFPPGQRCFRQHKVSLGRPAIYSERDNRRVLKHTADTWVDSFANNQIKLAELHERELG